MRPKLLSAAFVCLLSIPVRAEQSTPPPSLSGAPVTARLTWNRNSGAEECVTGDELRHAVNRRWGREVIRGQGPADLTLEGSIGPRGEGTWVAHLEMRRADGSSLGSREIATEAKDCSALDDSIALAAGLMLDMSRQRIAEERIAAAQKAAVAKVKVLEGPSIEIPKETPPARASWHAEPNLGAETLLWFLPGAAFGMRAGVAVEPPRFWRVEAAATLWAPVETREGSHGARFQTWSVDLGICPVESRNRSVTLRGCIVQRLGVVRAQGIGFARSDNPEETLFAVGARAALSWRFARRFDLQLGVRGETSLARYRFVYEDAQARSRTVYQMGPVAAGADLSLGTRF